MLQDIQHLIVQGRALILLELIHSLVLPRGTLCYSLMARLLLLMGQAERQVSEHREMQCETEIEEMVQHRAVDGMEQ